MKFFSENLDNLRKLYTSQLRKLLSAEQQIVEALPKMIAHSTDTQLKQAFQSHLQETREQAARLEQILKETMGEASPEKCKVMAALVVEAEEMVKDAADDDVRDAALLSAGQRVEHYEIASYGAVRHWAQILGRTADAELLDKTIKEEGHADHLLTQISNRVNEQARKGAPIERAEPIKPVGVTGTGELTEVERARGEVAEAPERIEPIRKRA